MNPIDHMRARAPMSLREMIDMREQAIADDAIPALADVRSAVRRADILCSLLRVRMAGNTGNRMAAAQSQAGMWAGCKCTRCCRAIGASRPLTLVDDVELCESGRAFWLALAPEVRFLLQHGVGR